MNIDLIVKISQMLLTPIIALITVYIAWQQWRGNLLKLRLERYERRLKIYQEVVTVLSLIIRAADVKIEDLRVFRVKIAEADFLFDSDITEYLDEIFERGHRLWKVNEQYRKYTKGDPADHAHSKVVEELDRQILWFSEQWIVIKQKFKKYLDIS